MKEQLLKNPFTEVIGQDRAKHQIASALLAQRHFVIVGPPGIGKTTIAREIAKLLPEAEVKENPFSNETKVMKSGLDRFVRVQGSPDLTVEDLFGDIDPVKALEFGPTSLQAFTPGKIFKADQGILFFDELNRAPEKTQNALLQVLEEGIVTIGSYNVNIPVSFIFIGTMNPEETAAAEKLSSVLMDRFDVVHMTYPEDIEDEREIVNKKGKDLGVAVPEHLLTVVLKFIKLLRENDNLVRKPSVRATLGLVERAQANAILNKHDEVTFQDLKEAVISVIAHRIELKPSLKYMQKPEQFVADMFNAFAREAEETGTHGGGDP